ncbi:hypothetical protein TNIN_104711 [Trichonephila inaurata madagascariensis]|uniref:C2H2-type domain-containing protein n=1 Tax=Trichonephila inaurata madagascariensis TaxID=2747483 RepID=A0A8X6X7Y1_9ARAC|nr:hypothetical protein TNIN_104711 [Trichonephila inaurata madagascariensis]
MSGHYPLIVVISKISKRFTSFSHTLSSTPRRHSRGFPIAHRTRRQPSFELAVKLFLCKICNKRFCSQKELWNHLHQSHSPSPKKGDAILAFPIEFQIAQMATPDEFSSFFMPKTPQPSCSQPTGVPSSTSPGVLKNNSPSHRSDDDFPPIVEQHVTELPSFHELSLHQDILSRSLLV